MPFHKQLSRVDGRNEVPTAAIVLTAVLQVLLAFINLEHSTAFNAILAMTGKYYLGILHMIAKVLLTNYLHYASDRHVSFIPATRGLHAPTQLNMSPPSYSPFWLKRLPGIAANVISIIWLTVAIVFSTFPSAMPVSAESLTTFRFTGG